MILLDNENNKYKIMIDKIYSIVSEKNYEVIILNNECYEEVKNNIINPRINKFYDGNYLLEIPDLPIILIIEPNNFDLEKMYDICYYQNIANLMIIYPIKSIDEFKYDINFNGYIEHIVYVSEGYFDENAVFLKQIMTEYTNSLYNILLNINKNKEFHI